MKQQTQQVSQKNVIVFDWLTLTSKIDSPESLMELLGLTGVSWQKMEKGRNGYRQRWLFENISILFDGAENMGVCLDISGTGCRALETYSTHKGDVWEHLISWLYLNEGDYNISRLDSSIAAVALASVAIATVVGSVFIGLGVMPGPDPTAFNDLVDRCITYLSGLGMVADESTIQVLKMNEGARMRYAVTQDVVELIRDWLFDTGVLMASVVSTGITVNNLYAESSKDWYVMPSEYSDDTPRRLASVLASMAFATEVFVYLSTGGSWAGLYWNESGQMVDCTLHRIDGVSDPELSLFGVQPLSDFEIAYSLVKPTFYSLDYVTSTSGCYVLAQGVDTTKRGIPVLEVIDGQLGADVYAYRGPIASQSSAVTMYWPDYNSLTWTDLEQIDASVGVSLGVVASPSVDVATGYDVWAGNAVNVSGSDVGRDEETVLAYPIFRGQTYEETIEATQEQVWEGESTYDDTTSDTVTGDTWADVTVTNFFGRLTNILSSLLNSLKEGLLSGISSLFVPTAAQMEGIKDQWDQLLQERFGAAYEAVGLIDEWAAVFQDQEVITTIEFPTVTIPLLGTDQFVFGGWMVKVVPDGFDFLITALKRIISIICTFWFIKGMRSRFEGALGGH